MVDAAVERLAAAVALLEGLRDVRRPLPASTPRALALHQHPPAETQRDVNSNLADQRI
jgi:hypothetical protein